MMQQKKIYDLPMSKSDDLLYHHEIDQEKQQNLKESQLRKNSLDNVVLEMPKKHHHKRNSYNSVTFHNENMKVKQIQVKKRILTQIAQYGYNAYMAEYLIEKQNISLEQDFQNLLDILMDKMHEFEEQYKACPQQKQKKATSKQVMPVSLDEQQNIQLDQFIEEVRFILKEENDKICGICMCEYANPQKPLSCKHKFCSKCITEYLENKINCAQVLDIECPGQGCESYFNSNIIKEFVNDEYYEKYEKFKQTKILDKDETVRWCVKPGCDKFVKGNIMSKVVRCECGQQMCYDCRREDHPGLTCDEALDKYYEQTLKQLVIQRCPKCKAPIQKKEGCNHMTCFQCRFQFCWLCRARYTRMHFDSDNCFGCPGICSSNPDKQFSTDEPSHRPLWKKYGGIVFEIFASTLILPLLPFILIYYSVMTPLKLLKWKNRQYYRGMDDGEKLCFLLLGIVLFPVFMALIIFPGSLFILAYKLRYD